MITVFMCDQNGGKATGLAIETLEAQSGFPRGKSTIQ